MSRLILTVVCALGLQNQLASCWQVDEQLMANCRNTYSEELRNDLLLGEWFEVSKFTLFGGLVPSSSCISNVFTKASEENLTIYEAQYNSPPPSLDDNPVLVSRFNGIFKGLVTGHNQAKDYFVEPGVFAPEQTIYNYKKLNDDYMLVWDCKLRGNIVWLHSRVNYPTAEDINAVIQGVPEVARLASQRLCAVF